MTRSLTQSHLDTEPTRLFPILIMLSTSSDSNPRPWDCLVSQNEWEADALLNLVGVESPAIGQFTRCILIRHTHVYACMYGSVCGPSGTGAEPMNHEARTRGTLGYMCAAVNFLSELINNALALNLYQNSTFYIWVKHE